jgi:hypothetical protein
MVYDLGDLPPHPPGDGRDDAWRSMLRSEGVPVSSDMAWRTDRPSEALRQFWTSDYSP